MKSFEHRQIVKSKRFKPLKNRLRAAGLQMPKDEGHRPAAPGESDAVLASAFEEEPQEKTLPYEPAHAWNGAAFAEAADQSGGAMLEEADGAEFDAEGNDDVEAGDAHHESNALYPGDRGELPFDLRRLLIYLLRGPYFERSQDKRLWTLLLGNADIIRARLSDLLLELVIDEAAGIAFCRKPALGDLQAPSLLPAVRLRFLDSALLLELRERLLRASETGERAVVTLFELRDLLQIYDAASLSNESTFLKHLAGIVERLKRRRILLPLKGGDSFEISRVLPLLFTSADIESLREAFRAKAARAAEAARQEPATAKTRRRRRRVRTPGEAMGASEADAATAGQAPEREDAPYKPDDLDAADAFDAFLGEDAAGDEDAAAVNELLINTTNEGDRA